MNEWSFVTATPDGMIISLDGRLPAIPMRVRDLCTGDGWEIDHAAIDVSVDQPTFWRLILSRPFAQQAKRTQHIDDTVIGWAAI